MIVTKGETLMNKISRDLFTVKELDDSKMIMLEDQKGYSRMWVQGTELDSFFEKIECQGGDVK